MAPAMYLAYVLSSLTFCSTAPASSLKKGDLCLFLVCDECCASSLDLDFIVNLPGTHLSLQYKLVQVSTQFLLSYNLH